MAGGCDRAALRHSSRPRSPRARQRSRCGGAAVPLPRLARDWDPGRGQRHDRPHRGRAEAAAADRQPPHHRALQASGPDATTPSPLLLSTTSRDPALFTPRLPDLTQTHKYLPRLAGAFGEKESGSDSDTFLCAFKRQKKKKKKRTHFQAQLRQTLNLSYLRFERLVWLWLPCPPSTAGSFFLNYSGMSRLGSITEGLQPQPTTQPGSQAPPPYREQRDPPGSTWTQQDTPPQQEP